MPAVGPSFDQFMPDHNDHEASRSSFIEAALWLEKYSPCLHDYSTMKP
jgi:hypothetical protein